MSLLKLTMDLNSAFLLLVVVVVKVVPVLINLFMFLFFFSSRHYDGVFRLISHLNVVKSMDILCATLKHSIFSVDQERENIPEEVLGAHLKGCHV